MSDSFCNKLTERTDQFVAAPDETEALARAIDLRAVEIYEGEGCDEADRADAKDLARALARTLLGQSLRAAFGAPGDWGYSTQIGKALAMVYAGQASNAPAPDETLPEFPMSQAQRVAISKDALDKLAHSMAYEVATRDTESFCNSVGESEADGETYDWWEIPDAHDGEWGGLVREALRYLDARGLVIRHPHMENWVALADESEAVR